jgi:hypothetical protein
MSAPLRRRQVQCRRRPDSHPNWLNFAGGVSHKDFRRSSTVVVVLIGGALHRPGGVLEMIINQIRSSEGADNSVRRY